MSHQVKTGVAEGGDGVEDAVPGAAEQAVVWDKADGKQASPDALHGQHGAQDEAEHPDDAAQLGCAHGLLQKETAGEADLPACDLVERHGYGDHPHAADLDEDQDNDLSEGAPTGGGVYGDEAGDTGGGCGGEEGGQKGRAAWAWAGEGEHEEQCPQQDDTSKAQQHRMGGRQANG